MDLQKIIDRIDAVTISENAAVTQLKHEEDGAPYRVWRIDSDGNSYILKEAKGIEKDIYPYIRSAAEDCIPSLHQIIPFGGHTYLLMQYIEGADLCRCDRRKLTNGLDALISLQQRTWGQQTIDALEETYEKSLLQRQDRGNYLKDPLLEEAYRTFLEVYQTVPRTLCHDDLLPFNIISSEHRAVLIDWEVGGILPYPASFARLIAHAEENPEALFYMTEADKRFAIDYYYDQLLKDKGISHSQWRDTLAYFLFYEYCEWVFVGNKYGTTDGEYYKKYLPMAKRQAEKILKLRMGKCSTP